MLSVILLARFDLARMVLHCTVAAKHKRLDAGGELVMSELFHVLLTALIISSRYGLQCLFHLAEFF